MEEGIRKSKRIREKKLNKEGEISKEEITTSNNKLTSIKKKLRKIKKKKD